MLSSSRSQLGPSCWRLLGTCTRTCMHVLGWAVFSVLGARVAWNNYPHGSTCSAVMLEPSLLHPCARWLTCQRLCELNTKKVRNIGNICGLSPSCETLTICFRFSLLQGASSRIGYRIVFFMCKSVSSCCQRLRYKTYRQTDRRTDRQTDRQCVRTLYRQRIRCDVFLF